MSTASDYRADGGLNIVMKHTHIDDHTSKGETPMSNIGLTEAEANEIKAERFAKEKDEERKARTGLSSLAMTDAESKAVQKTPNRVALADIEAAIKHVEYINTMIMPHLTICVLYLENGWAEIGHSAPADAENFDAELGKKFAYENAMRKLWPLFGFALRDRLSRSGPPYTSESEWPGPRGAEQSRPFNPVSQEQEKAAMEARGKEYRGGVVSAQQPLPEVDDNGNPTVQQGPDEKEDK